jgi:glycosyltransferase involved in cell wall biosynthesis
MKLKILQVVHGFPPRQQGGTEIYTYNLSKELKKKHVVQVFYPLSGNRFHLNSLDSENSKICKLNTDLTLFQKIRRTITFESTYLNEQIDYEFKTILERVRPDIIHFQHLLNMSTSLLQTAKELGIPTVLTLHDFWFICPGIHLLRNDFSICKGPDKAARSCFKCWNRRQAKFLIEYVMGRSSKIVVELLKSILVSFNEWEKFEERNDYMIALLEKVDTIIVPSEFVRSIFMKKGISGNKLIRSYNGYNLDIFRSFKKKRKKKNSKIVFGFVGTIAKHKGIDVLIEAFNMIKHENAELRIYGQFFHSSYLKEIEKKIQNPFVKIIGPFKDPKVPFSEIDVLIVPSIWYETGGPLVIEEAQATKTPVIASNIGCISEFVQNNKNGLLFNPGCSSDLYEKILMFIQNPNLIPKFQINITPPRSITDQAKELEIIYQDLIGRERNVTS